MIICIILIFCIFGTKVQYKEPERKIITFRKMIGNLLHTWPTQTSVILSLSTLARKESDWKPKQHIAVTRKGTENQHLIRPSKRSSYRIKLSQIDIKARRGDGIKINHIISALRKADKEAISGACSLAEGRKAVISAVGTAVGAETGRGSREGDTRHRSPWRERKWGPGGFWNWCLIFQETFLCLYLIVYFFNLTDFAIHLPMSVMYIYAHGRTHTHTLHTLTYTHTE